MGLLRRLGRKGQTGQSLVILAIGFLALLGFVGIVTDVSVLFIRYSTMRRAVDAAAIAAAGQMRRVQDTKLGLSTPIADGQATSIANLNLAARQFIEVYGLNPKSVLVETCRSQQVAIDPTTQQPLDKNGVALFVLDTATGRYIPNTAADQATLKKYQQLCTSDELKLVRVTAQIDAPTIFLRLLGYPTVTLTESAISQTAVIDVVMIFDVSESMMNQTTYADWDHIPGAAHPEGVRYMPPWIWSYDHGNTDITAGPLRADPWADVSGNNEANLNLRINVGTDASGYVPAKPTDAVFNDKVIAFEPTIALGATADTDPVPGPSQWKEFGVGASPVGRVEPRAFCRVRAYQGTYSGYPVDPALRQVYLNFFDNIYQSTHPGENYPAQFGAKYGLSVADSPTPSTKFSLFVPMYNYYGCCNDPDGNFAFDDLVCQPFKDARDAAHQFLDRLDFLRGDRVAFVAFDRQASIIDPDGDGPQASMIETQADIPDPANPTGPPLRKGADNVLNDVIGVRGENTFYSDTNNDGMWDGLYDSGVAKDYNALLTTSVGSLVDNPVAAACPYDTAVLPWEFVPSAKYLPSGNQRKSGSGNGSAILDDVLSVPDWYMTSGTSLSTQPGDQNPVTTPGYNARYRSYEYRASCAGTNIGAGLQAGSATLFNEGRREGAVWIMVMLSDGAAGASNPISKYHGVDLVHPNPYAVVGPVTATGKNYDGTCLSDLDPITNLCPAPVPPVVMPFVYSPLVGKFGPAIANPKNAGGYGVFGLCPYGPPDGSKPSLLLSGTGLDRFPECDDLHPETRHFCGATALNPDSALDADPNCFYYYDVDDYARDWADWVGLAVLPGVELTAGTGRVGDQLLPSIFTIGFGINYDTNGIDGIHTACAATDTNCIRGITDPASWPTFASQSAKNTYLGPYNLRNADYLGEELLRYIADIGDNNQIDSDYWQLCESKNAPAYDPAFAYSAAGGPFSCRDDGGTNSGDRIGNPIDLTLPNWGARGPCESPYDPLTANTRGEYYLPKTPGTACGNYYVAATGTQLEAVFDQIASRMFTRLSQ
ncbi:MAG: hypothetical protein ABI700_07960 [Chloroflexota bacterium]